MKKDKKKNQNEQYEKLFPHLFTDDESSEEEQEIDDFLFMDLIDGEF